jgi:hypothetical protein
MPATGFILLLLGLWVLLRTIRHNVPVKTASGKIEEGGLVEKLLG